MGAVAAVVLLLGACASSQTSSAPARRGSPNLISRAEIEATTAGSAYDVIMRLRSNWFSSTPAGTVRGQTTAQILYYHDNMRLSDRNALMSIPVSQIRSIRLLTPSEAARVLPDVGTMGSAPFTAVIYVISRDR